MHDIEPHYQWRDRYIAAEDENSPFFGRQYSEFEFSNKIYNYFIHPQWDGIGSPTLYTKLLYADYDQGFAIFEMIGEWNDCVNNDIMFLKRKIIDPLLEKGIHKYILICENIMVFHGGEDAYYEEWLEEVQEENGWISCINLPEHVYVDMKDAQIQNFILMGEILNQVNWRPHKPEAFFIVLEKIIEAQQNMIGY